MSNDPEARARAVIADAERAIARAEEQLREGEELFRKMNVERGAARRAIEALPSEGRAKALQELEQWQEEVARDVRSHVDLAKQARRPSAKVKPGALRI